MSVIEKLRRSAQSERELGNTRAAAAFDAKADAMQSKSGLVPVKLDDITAERRRVEEAWSAMALDPEMRVVLLVDEGLSRAVRRELPMRLALPLLRAEKARLLGRVDDTWVNVQADVSNTPPLNQKPSTTLFI